MKRILITGGRDYSNKGVINEALKAIVDESPESSFIVVHGGASGADTLASECAHELGLKEECHNADWKKHGKRAGPIRNAHMVNLGADVCLAFPSPDSKGTWHCIKKAEDAGIDTRVFETRPEGMRYKAIRHDLFSLPSDYVLAHCISQDAKMGAGIARTIRDKWDIYHVAELGRMKVLDVGTSLLQQDGGPYPVFHMITKEKYWHKPTRDNFNKALKDMSEQVKRKGIKKLGMPLIGSGLDQLDWNETDKVIRETFKHIPVDIVVCVLPDSKKEEK